MRQRERFFFPIAMLSLLTLAGCAPRTATTGETVKARAESAAIAEPKPTVELLSWDQVQVRRRQLLGKVVVIDVWSTYCDPCVREFPRLVELQKRFGEEVACISFNTDYAGAKDAVPESFRAPVVRFLANHHAHLLNVISIDPSEDFFNKIHLGGPPAAFVYARDGKLARRFDNSNSPKTPEFTYRRDVLPLVAKLLVKSK